MAKRILVVEDNDLNRKLFCDVLRAGGHEVEGCADGEAVLSAAREAVGGEKGRVIAVAQPHRYTRLRDLMEDFQTCFNEADMVYVTPVYEAGEAPIDGVSADALVEGLKSRGHRSAQTIPDQHALAAALATEITAGDIVVCLGAGDITRWAAGLAAAIESKRGA